MNRPVIHRTRLIPPPPRQNRGQWDWLKLISILLALIGIGIMLYSLYIQLGAVYLP